MRASYDCVQSDGCGGEDLIEALRVVEDSEYGQLIFRHDRRRPPAGLGQHDNWSNDGITAASDLDAVDLTAQIGSAELRSHPNNPWAPTVTDEVGAWTTSRARRHLLKVVRRRVVRSATRYAAVAVLLGVGAAFNPVLWGGVAAVVAIAAFRPGMAFVRYRRLRGARDAIRGRAAATVRGEYHSKAAVTDVTFGGRTERVRTVGLFGEPAATDGDVWLLSSSAGRPIAVGRVASGRVVFRKQ